MFLPQRTTLNVSLLHLLSTLDKFGLIKLKIRAPFTSLYIKHSIPPSKQTIYIQLLKVIFQREKMVSSKIQNSIYDINISTVVPGLMSGHDTVQEPGAMDLVMKLHYLRIVYYFKTPTFDGFTILKIKETMFNWLNNAYITCGRFRRADSGRPFIKCNDSGVRVIEAKCRLSLDEWLESKDDSKHKLLVSNQVLGPDLAYSPLVLIQVCLIVFPFIIIFCVEYSIIQT